jgi:hypothetical protein
MRIIPFPADRPLPDQEAWTASLEAALHGDAQGPAADTWRELRDDVRSLAPAMSPAFEGSLARGLERLGALQGGAVDADTQAPSHGSADTSGRVSAGDAPTLRTGAFARLRRAPRSLASNRRAAVGAAATAAAVFVAALLIAGPLGSRPAIESAPVHRAPAAASGASKPVLGSSSTPAGSATSRGSSASAKSSEAQQASPLIGAPGAAGGAPAQPGRLQQLAASVTLGSTPANLQAISDQVAALTVRDGGYGASEATLALRLPSARLSAALAAIGRLAPIRAESRSLQDITDAYDAARQQLSDAEAERRALLRALAAATTEGQIASLRERLSASRAAVARAHSSVNAVSQRASTAEVEVSILGDVRAGSEGLTLRRGLHDGARVLVVALIVVLIASCILVPLALVLAALAGARSAWRRYQREGVLDGR